MPIEGLRYIDRFVTDAEELQLLQAIDREPWLTDLWRRVQHYGYRYDYKVRSVDASQRLGPLPDWVQPLVRRLTGLYMEQAPDQLIVNEYQPGQGIGAHVDAPPFGPEISSVSLSAPCVMDFTEVAGPGRVSLVLARRSLLVLSGPAQYGWKHAIPVRGSDTIEGRDVPRGRRVSLTFRTVVASRTESFGDGTAARNSGAT
jgi:alkylated DNA repair dioxygenase AlkB